MVALFSIILSTFCISKDLKQNKIQVAKVCFHSRNQTDRYHQIDFEADTDI